MEIFFKFPGGWKCGGNFLDISRVGVEISWKFPRGGGNLVEISWKFPRWEISLGDISCKCPRRGGYI